MARAAPRPITQLQTQKGGGKGTRLCGALRGSFRKLETQARPERLVRPHLIAGRLPREKTDDGLEFPAVERIDLTCPCRTFVSRDPIDGNEHTLPPPPHPPTNPPLGSSQQHHKQ